MCWIVIHTGTAVQLQELNTASGYFHRLALGKQGGGVYAINQYSPWPVNGSEDNRCIYCINLNGQPQCNESCTA